MKIIGVIQSRMGSSRLKGKSLMKITDKTLLDLVITNAKKNKFFNDIIVATSTNNEDDRIQIHCQAIDVKYHRGDPVNVLSRFMNISDSLNDSDIIVRITADNPINNQKVSNSLLIHHIENNNDYSCIQGLSHIVYEYITVRAFKKLKLFEKELLAYDKEHVTSFFRKNPEAFKISEIAPQKFNLNQHIDRFLTIDTKEDLERFIALNKNFNFDDEINLEELYQTVSKLIEA